MLDPRLVVSRLDEVRAQLSRRGPAAAATLDEVAKVAEERREAKSRGDELRMRQNAANQEMRSLDKAGADFAARREELKAIGQQIKALEDSEKQSEQRLEELLLYIPNLPAPECPDGTSEADNPVRRTWGEKPSFAFEPRPHWEVGERLGMLDFERATKVAEPRFAVLYGLLARLERALVTFFLDVHTREHGYREVYPPFLVSGASMTGTGQLPKFAADAYKIEGQDLYLVPTAEVPVTNLHRDEVLDAGQLPIAYAAYTPCFRSEAGSYGKDVRGYIRQHQFDKVELVRFCRPEESPAQHEMLTRHAETILEKLGLHYRRVELCTADLGAGAAALLRPRGLAARAGRVPRDLELLELPRLPGPASAHPVQGGGRQAPARPHVERIGARGGSHARRDPRELPAARRQRGRAGGAAAPDGHGPDHGALSRVRSAGVGLLGAELERVAHVHLATLGRGREVRRVHRLANALGEDGIGRQRRRGPVGVDPAVLDDATDVRLGRDREVDDEAPLGPRPLPQRQVVALGQELRQVPDAPADVVGRERGARLVRGSGRRGRGVRRAGRLAPRPRPRDVAEEPSPSLDLGLARQGSPRRGRARQGRGRGPRALPRGRAKRDARRPGRREPAGGGRTPATIAASTTTTPMASRPRDTRRGYRTGRNSRGRIAIRRRARLPDPRRYPQSPLSPGAAAPARRASTVAYPGATPARGPSTSWGIHAARCAPCPSRARATTTRAASASGDRRPSRASSHRGCTAAASRGRCAP